MDLQNSKSFFLETVFKVYVMDILKTNEPNNFNFFFFLIERGHFLWGTKFN